MATKSILLKKDEFKKINNGGIIDGATFILQAQNYEIYIGTVTQGDSPPQEVNCFRIIGTFAYTGEEDVYAKAVFEPVKVVIDEI